MTMIEYGALTTEQQLDYLSDIGVKLHSQAQPTFNYSYYQVDEFFVRLTLSLERMAITHIQVSSTAIHNVLSKKQEAIIIEKVAHKVNKEISSSDFLQQ